MDNNYDVKFVVVALNKLGMPTFYPMEVEDVMGYYVSKAFIASDETKYDSQGREYHAYDVVLPYGDLRKKEMMI